MNGYKEKFTETQRLPFRKDRVCFPMKYDIRHIDRSPNQNMLTLFEHTSIPFESKASIKPNEDIFYTQ